MHLAISAGKDNPIYNILQQANVSFNNLNLEAFTSPEEGFRLDAGIYNLMIGIQPANLQKYSRQPLGKDELEVARGRYLREHLPELK